MLSIPYIHSYNSKSYNSGDRTNLKMTNSVKNFPIETLLDTCAEKTSPQFQTAWTELIQRYKNYVAVIANKKYHIWNNNHSRIDLSEITNDIINNVFMVLYLDDCSALKLFKARTSERAFCGYLATITNRLAIRSLKKYLKDGTVYSTTDIQDHAANEDKSWWQFFDYVVNKIRKKSRQKPKAY